MFTDQISIYGFDIVDCVTGDIIAIAKDARTAYRFIRLNKLRVEKNQPRGVYVTPGTILTMNDYGGVDAEWLDPMPNVEIL